MEFKFTKQVLLALIFANVGVVSTTSAAELKSISPGAMVIQNLAQAMGGAVAINNVQSQKILAQVQRFEPEQTFKPGADPLSVLTINRTLTKDLSQQRYKANWQVNTVYPVIAEYNYTEVINGSDGFVSGVDSFFSSGQAVSMQSIRLGARVKQYNMTSPLSLVRHALDANTVVTYKGKEDIDNATYEVVTVSAGDESIMLYVNSESHLLRKAEILEDDSIYGDVIWEIKYENWARVDELKLPFKVTSKLKNKKIAIENRDAIYLNVELNDGMFKIPDELESIFDPNLFAWGLRSSQMFNRLLPLGVPFDVDQTKPENMVEIAPGIFHILGFTHHSLVIEMSDFLVMVESALYDDRSQTIIAMLKDKWPDKPIRYTVVSHFHSDHSGGVRGFGAVGSSIVVGKETRKHYEKIFKAPHTFYPDAYSKMPVAVNFISVDEENPYVISDGERVVQIIDIPNSHAIGMLMPYVEDVKLIFASDLYSPGGTDPLVPQFSYWAFDLYDALTSSELDIELVAGAHGGISSYAQFLSHVEASR